MDADEIARMPIASLRDELERVQAENAQLRAGAEPGAIEMVHQLHRAVYGDSWARPESPAQVWEMLLEHVRRLACRMCGACERGDSSAATNARLQQLVADYGAEIRRLQEELDGADWETR